MQGSGTPEIGMGIGLNIASDLLVGANGELGHGPGKGRIGRLMIKGYQRFLTGYTQPCPNKVSCSDYGLQAVSEYGTVRGLAAAARRVIHCKEIAAENGWFDNTEPAHNPAGLCGFGPANNQMPRIELGDTV